MTLQFVGRSQGRPHWAAVTLSAAAFLPETLGENLFLCLFCRPEAVCIPFLAGLPPLSQPATLHLSAPSFQRCVFLGPSSDPFSHCDCIGATWTSQDDLPTSRSAHQQPNFSLPCNITYSQVLGIRMWSSLGGHGVVCHRSRTASLRLTHEDTGLRGDSTCEGDQN